MTEGSRGDTPPRLHILAVAGAFPKLSETFVRRQVEALHQAGHRVTVIAGAPTADEPPLDPPPDELRVLHLPPRPEGVLARRTQAVRTALRAFGRAPVGTWRILRRPALSWHERWLTLQTLLLVRELPDVDVVHAHFGPYGARATEVFRALGRPVPVVTAFHGIDITLPLAQEGLGVYDRLFRDGALLLPISDHWRERLIELGAPPERTVVHRMGVAVQELATSLRSATDELRVLSIGRLVEKKGFDDGLVALAKARSDGSAARLTIVGDGPERLRLERLAHELGVQQHVTFLGAVPHARTLELLTTHDVLLCPSRTAANGDQEGIPVVLMEAMATGMPVVSTRHSGIPELVEHERCGLLSDERDTDGLARSLRQLEADPGERQRLGDEGRRKVEQNFDSAMLDVELERILRDIAGARSPRRRGAERPEHREHRHITQSSARANVAGRSLRRERVMFRRIYRSELRRTRGGLRARAGRIKRELSWPVIMLRLALDALRRCGGPVADRIGVPRWRQLAMMCWIGLRYRFPPEIYYRYRLYRPERAREAASYLHWDEHNRVLGRLIRRQYPVEARQLDDKRSFLAWCQDRDLPVAGILAVFEAGRGTVDADSLPDGDLFSKPADGRGGEDGRAWLRTPTGHYDVGDGTTVSKQQIVELLEQASQRRPYLLQRRMEPAPAVRRLTGGGLPTVRIVTGRPPGGPPELLAASFGMPRGGNPVDNYHAGGICSRIDPATGRIGPGVTVDLGECLTEHLIHPDTGAPIAGATVPDWPATVELALRAHAATDRIAFVGWDIVPTASGPVLLEANVRWDAAMPQAPEGDPLGNGMYLPWLLAHLEQAPRAG